MKKKIISLRGTSGAGKSTTLQLLYRFLLTYPNAKPLSFRSLGRMLDFVATLEIEGHIVGIFNRGDAPKVVHELLEELEENRCEVIVCATRTKGEVENVLQSFKRRYELSVVPKEASTSKSHALSNHAAAHALAAQVYSAVDA